MIHEDDWDHHWHEYAGAIARNPAQEFRRRLILRLLAAGGTPSRVLDVGSGSGDFAIALRAAFPEAKLLGLELSSTGVEQSRRKVPDADFVQCDLIAGDPAPGDYFGWATHAVCSEVLEHVDDPKLLLRNARAYLAPGSRLVVTVPGGPMTAFDRHIGHRRHFRADDLAQVLRNSGFEAVRVTGAGFPSFNLYRLFLLTLGRGLIDHAGSATPSAAARAATSAFDLLLRHNTRLSRYGWQTVGTARLPYAARP